MEKLSSVELAKGFYIYQSVETVYGASFIEARRSKRGLAVYWRSYINNREKKPYIQFDLYIREIIDEFVRPEYLPLRFLYG
jgi:hypothetical protein